MKKTLSLLTLVIALSSSVFAQGNDVSLEGGSVNVRIFNNSDKPEDNVEGSPYLNSDFQSALINDVDKDYSVRYNAYKDQIEVKTSNDDVFILNDKSKDYKIVLVDSDLTIQKVKIEGESRYAFNVWENEELKLVRTYKVGFVPEREGDGYKASSKAKFTSPEETLYLIELDNGNTQEISNRKNKIFRTVFTKDIKDTAKERGLDPTKTEDLIELLELL